MKIVIPDDYQDAVRTLDCYAKLAAHDVTIYNDTVTDTAALAERFRDADALVLIRERTPIDDALLAQLPRLRLIAQTGRGTAHIDTKACERRGIEVAVGTGSPIAPAELTWALVMAAMRFLPQEVASARAGRWQSHLGRALRGRTLGVYGYGKIGTLVAGYGRAFGMKVIVFGREGSLARATSDGYLTTSRQELFSTSDALSLHLRLTGETQGIVTRADLASMKPDALLVNTSRAELIEEGALVEALRAGRPGFAAVDVYESEPWTEHPLLAMDNVLCTPHLGYVERDSYELYFGQAFDAVNAWVFTTEAQRTQRGTESSS
ncbi:MAG TPA: D-2-hydroxyacid dehydrogenase family protein [Thermoanaerobaculia bacterium]|nr:D-2-hydroxyacid dehydrogenase family protein [Thermoanaerobaculia bacterium]